MEWIQATSRPCHHNRFPIRLVRRPLPSGTPPSLEQTSQPRTTLMNWRWRKVHRAPLRLTPWRWSRTAHFVDGFPGHDHQMKTVIDDLSPGKVFADPFGVTMQHVHGDPFNVLAIPAVSSQFLSELFDSVTTSAFGDIE